MKIHFKIISMFMQRSWTEIEWERDDDKRTRRKMFSVENYFG